MPGMPQELAPQPASDTAQELTNLLERSGTDDTASRLVEVYERIERSYRAAMLAGHPAAGVAATTDLREVV